ncbi:MAG TPA: uroporphyrinogen-III synthase, partial [Prolixibacteraceae bacterium]|nr:uroporphyrinogen-III synthase [Prolixibacteraceae bacterium]
MKKTLRNKLFISTRPKGRSVELKRLFEARGAELLDLPMIEVQAAEVSDQEKKWMANLENFQWLIFTSPNGVNFFFQQLNETT